MNKTPGKVTPILHSIYQTRCCLHLLLLLLYTFFSKKHIIFKMVRNFFIGGNWKMNGSVKQAKELVEMLNGFEVPANTGKFFFLFI